MEQDRYLVLSPCSPSLNQNAHWGLHPLSKPWFSLLYRSFLSLISLPFYPVWLKVASGFRNCRGVCKWGRKELTTSTCSVTPVRHNWLQNFMSSEKYTQTCWFCAHNFCQQEDVKEDTTHGMDVPHKFMANWKRLRFQYHIFNTKIWGICWICQYGPCHKP